MHSRSETRLRAAHGLVVFVLFLTSILPLPALAQEPAPVAPAAPAAAVEHWIGTGVVDGHIDRVTNAPAPFWLEPEVVDGSSTIGYDLRVTEGVDADRAHHDPTDDISLRREAHTTPEPPWRPSPLA